MLLTQNFTSLLIKFSISIAFPLTLSACNYKHTHTTVSIFAMNTMGLYEPVTYSKVLWLINSTGPFKPMTYGKDLFILLLLLRSPARSLGFTILGEICAYVTIFYPTIEAVTFFLREWCMLGVFLLPAFTPLGHERQDLLSQCDGMHVCTDRPQLIL